jgi:hypothetical protein
MLQEIPAVNPAGISYFNESLLIYDIVNRKACHDQNANNKQGFSHG